MDTYTEIDLAFLQDMLGAGALIPTNRQQFSTLSLEGPPVNQEHCNDGTAAAFCIIS